MATSPPRSGRLSLGVWCGNTPEFITAKPRTGRAGSNTAADHIEMLGEAIAQIPAVQIHRKNLLIRSDGAGACQHLLDWLTEQGKVRGRRGITPSSSRSPSRSATRSRHSL